MGNMLKMIILLSLAFFNYNYASLYRSNVNSKINLINFILDFWYLTSIFIPFILLAALAVSFFVYIDNTFK